MNPSRSVVATKGGGEKKLLPQAQQSSSSSSSSEDSVSFTKAFGGNHSKKIMLSSQQPQRPSSINNKTTLSARHDDDDDDDDESDDDDDNDESTRSDTTSVKNNMQDASLESSSLLLSSQQPLPATIHFKATTTTTKSKSKQQQDNANNNNNKNSNNKAPSVARDDDTDVSSDSDGSNDSDNGGSSSDKDDNEYYDSLSDTTSAKAMPSDDDDDDESLATQPPPPSCNERSNTTTATTTTTTATVTTTKVPLLQKKTNHTTTKTKAAVPPINRYNVFLKANFQRFRQDFPRLEHGALMRRIGRTWKSLPVAEKNRYEQTSNDNSQRDNDDKDDDDDDEGSVSSTTSTTLLFSSASTKVAGKMIPKRKKTSSGGGPQQHDNDDKPKEQQSRKRTHNTKALEAVSAKETPRGGGGKKRRVTPKARSPAKATTSSLGTYHNNFAAFNGFMTKMRAKYPSIPYFELQQQCHDIWSKKSVHQKKRYIVPVSSAAQQPSAAKSTATETASRKRRSSQQDNQHAAKPSSSKAPARKRSATATLTTATARFTGGATQRRGTVEKRRSGTGGATNKTAAGQKTYTLSAYNIFVRDNVSRLRKARPELTQQELISTLGRKWSSLSRNEKQVYADRLRKEEGIDRPIAATAGNKKNSGKEVRATPRSSTNKKAPTPHRRPRVAHQTQPGEETKVSEKEKKGTPKETPKTTSIVPTRRKAPDYTPLLKEHIDLMAVDVAIENYVRHGFIHPDLIQALENLCPMEPSKSIQADTVRSKPPAAMLEAIRIARKNGRLTSDGCIEPLNTPKMQDDGTYSFPCGRRFSNFDWDQRRGLWVPRSIPPQVTKESESEDAEEGHQPEDTQDGGKSSDSLALVIPAACPNIPFFRRAQSENRVTADGFVKPAITPSTLRDGTFGRPWGATPKGMKWNAIRGVWVYANDDNANGNHQVGSIVKPSSSSSSTNFARITPDEDLQTPKAPEQDQNEKFLRPNGATPNGFSWDAVRGAWVPFGEENTEETCEDRPGVFQESASGGGALAPNLVDSFAHLRLIDVPSTTGQQGNISSPQRTIQPVKRRPTPQRPTGQKQSTNREQALGIEGSWSGHRFLSWHQRTNTSAFHQRPSSGLAAYSVGISVQSLDYAHNSMVTADVLGRTKFQGSTLGQTLPHQESDGANGASPSGLDHHRDTLQDSGASLFFFGENQASGAKTSDESPVASLQSQDLP